MPRPAKVKLKIESLDDKGRGVALHQGQAFSYPFTIPGEEIEVASETPRGKPSTSSRPDSGSRAFSLLQASPDRIQAPCPYFGPCGGCQLQHMTYSRQLTEKQRWLQKMLAPIVEPERIRPILASPRDYHYRRRVQWHVGPRGEVGYYSAHSQKVVDIDRCLIVDEALNGEIPSLKRQAKELLEVPRRPAELGFELTLQENGGVETRRLGEERGFLQVNPQANAMMLDALRSAFQKERSGRVLELFAGEGNLSFALSEAGQTWVAVEANPVSVKKALADPRQGRLKIRWIRESAEKAVKKLLSQRESFDRILLDPPREGVGRLMPDLVGLKPSSIFYISCWPRHLAQDLKSVLKGGYRVEWVQPIDFFPQTMHLETLALCRRI